MTLLIGYGFETRIMLEALHELANKRGIDSHDLNKALDLINRIEKGRKCDEERLEKKKKR